MAAIDEVLQRFERDGEFRRRVAEDPAEALAGYALSADDLSRLVDVVARDAPPDAQRARRSAFFALVARRAAEERSTRPPPEAPTC